MPLDPALQDTAVTDVLAASTVGSVMVTVLVSEQPLLSVTVTVYVPAARPVLSSVVTPLPQLYVYGAVPPVTVRSTEPVAFPKQATFICVVLVASGALG